MNRSIRRALALVVALIMAMPAFALAEDPDAPQATPAEAQAIVDPVEESASDDSERESPDDGAEDAATDAEPIADETPDLPEATPDAPLADTEIAEDPEPTEIVPDVTDVYVESSDALDAVVYVAPVEDTPEETEAMMGDPDAEDAEPLILAAEPEIQVYEEAPGDNDALLDAYVQNMIDESLGKTSKPRLFAANTQLSGANAVVFNIAKAAVEAIASSDTSTPIAIIEIPVEKLTEAGIDCGPWSASELGVESTIETENNTIYPASEAAEKARAKLDFNLSRVINALRFDCPGAMYWYGNHSLLYKPSVYPVINSEGTYNLELTGSMRICMVVSENYADTTATYDRSKLSAQDNYCYAVLTDKVTRAKEALANARAIVEGGAGQPVLQRLEYYRKSICDLVSYNHAAVENSSTPYGDPWQLVYVFDKDPNTQVVCEGYAKAFKYLFDLTYSDTESMECLLVTGWMRGGTGEGKHMWNIVHMDDGKNYLVDVTNCDENAIGAPDKLFMAYGPTGSVNTGYTFSLNSGNITYQYDYTGSDDTRTSYTDEDLTISQTPYVPQQWSIAIDGDIASGQVTASATSARQGETISLTVQPDAGYQLKRLSVTTDGGSEVSLSGNDFTMPAANVTVSATFEPIPATAPDITAQPTALTLTYGYAEGSALTVAAGEIGGHALSYQWYSGASAGDGAAIEGATRARYEIPTGRAVGTVYYYCVVTATRGDNGQTATRTSEAVSVTVGPKSVAISRLTAADKVYDGTVEAAVEGTPQVTGRVGNDDVTVTPGTAAFEDADVGLSKSVSFSGFALSGADAGNYVLSAQPDNVTAAISAREITIAAANQSVTVNSAIDDSLAQVRVEGALAEGQRLAAVTLTADSTAEATTTGAIKPSAAKILSGEADVTNNYDITYINGTLTVSLRLPEFTAPIADENLTYTGAPQALVTPGSAGDGCTLLYATGDSAVNAPAGGWSETAPTAANVGDYIVWYKVNGGEGYGDVGPVSLECAIVPASIADATVTLDANGFDYDGEAHSVSVTGVTLGNRALEIDADYTVDSASDTVASAEGRYTVTVNGRGNYTGSAAATWTIAKAVADKSTLTAAQKPAATSQSYAGATRQLVAAPTSLPEGYTGVQYSLNGGAWSAAIPTAASADRYTVRVKYVGDAYHADFEGDAIVVVISNPPAVNTPKPTATPAPSSGSSGSSSSGSSGSSSNDSAPVPAPTTPTIYAPSNAKATVSVGTAYQIDTAGATAKSFKSSNKKVATVTGGGIVVPKKAGKAKITFKVGKKKRTVTLKVVDPTIPTAIALNLAGTVAAQKGVPQALTVTLPEGTYSGVKWKSSNKKVATVNKFGVVTFKKAGKVTITATATRGKKKAKVKFVVSK